MKDLDRSNGLWALLHVAVFIAQTGCTSLGETFDAEQASKIRNGMHRDEVIAIMGSEPSKVEGSDPWKTVWIFSVADPISFGTRTERVSFTFDENNRLYGLPKMQGLPADEASTKD